MRQVSLVLHTTPLHLNYGQFCLPAERPHCMIILLLRLIRAVFKSKTISLRRWQSALLRSKRSVNFKRKADCVSHVLQCLAGIHERVDNSCTRRAECPRRSFVIVHTEHGQGQAPFMREKSAYLAEVGVTEQILRKFPNSQKSWGNWACANSVYQGSFLSAHALEPGNEAGQTKDEGDFKQNVKLFQSCYYLLHFLDTIWPLDRFSFSADNCL